MSLSSSIKNINKLLKILENEITVLEDKQLTILLIYICQNNGIDINKLHTLKNFNFKEIHILRLNKFKFIKIKNNKIYYTDKGYQIFEIIKNAQYNIEKFNNKIIDGYKIIKLIGRGSTSVTYKAININVVSKEDKEVVLKIFKPGILDRINIGKCLEKVGEISSPTIVTPFSFGSFEWKGIIIKYIVLKYIKGNSLSNILQSDSNIVIKSFLENFITEMAKALSIIEKYKLNHGDLHSENILAVKDIYDPNIVHFKIIDFAGIPTSKNLQSLEQTDIDYFKDNVRKILLKYATTDNGFIDRDKLGERLFNVCNNLNLNKYKSFKEILYDVNKPSANLRKLRIKEPPFNYLIFEDYDFNNHLWLDRFEPDKNLYSAIREFGATIISGPRGCGKTIYYRALSFNPILIHNLKIKHKKYLLKKITDFRKIFGIYFGLRLGEFALFSNKNFEFNSRIENFLKHILCIKIISKTISLISDAYQYKVFSGNEDIKSITDFLNNYMKPSILTQSKSKLKELYDLLSIEEDFCISQLRKGYKDDYPKSGLLLDEMKLKKFFEIISLQIPELSNSRFYIIFDDVSHPLMTFETQRILNDIIRARNQLYCCKVSTEKYGYEFIDSKGKILQPRDDFNYIDLSTLGKENKDSYSNEYKKYLEKIVNRHLAIAGFNRGIREILSELPYTHRSLIKLLSLNARNEKAINQRANSSPLKKKILYGGWDIICHLSSGSIRVALDICNHIFKSVPKSRVLNIKSGREIISIKTQNKSIIRFSQNEYANLLTIQDLGKRFFDIVRNFGWLSRRKLETEVRKNEPGEYMTIERTDNKDLNPEAHRILSSLIRWSVFIDHGLTFSKSQIGLVQKFTLHKRFSPALKTTFRERDHFRLSTKNIQEILLEPDIFVKTYKEKEEKKIKRTEQLNLFR